MDAAVQDIKNSYREALERGLPFPIIYSLQFFSVDDGGLIWQRAIRSAGHFTSIVFWCVRLLPVSYRIMLDLFIYLKKQQRACLYH